LLLNFIDFFDIREKILLNAKYTERCMVGLKILGTTSLVPSCTSTFAPKANGGDWKICENI
jgi:hypothetical protein